ncbi:DUF898 domain-containing protein [Curvibacter sp. CHRR-16]|uniref:YjgN family protein n=1 Tax=Curvibacter sp. CHRR-16 TaxID=2835872 RepID=UPI001BDA8E65|nr:YjgN family protein [Curvibacter sp. CHRR-16]MBT0571024.1 DUF898 domain-containing protein [Curvibacter sp. CHRR-16]
MPPTAETQDDIPSPLLHQPVRHTFMPIRFTGTGSEYFRIWLVNLLLIAVTLGLYYPWAKARKMRYFWGHTMVGNHPLSFHGDARKMFRGQMLMGILFTLYSVASEFSLVAGLFAFGVLCFLGPALLRSAMQFRLANTSWRGIRLRFSGSLADAYRAALPMVLPLLIVSLSPLMDGPENDTPAWLGALPGLIVLISFLASPWMFWKLKHYQHSHYALGPLETSFRARPRTFYGLLLRLFLLLVLAVAVGIAVGYWVPQMTGQGIHAIAGFLVVVAGVAAVFLVAKPYTTARLQNVVWTETGNHEIRFISALAPKDLVLLTMKNWLLVLITVGFYWPFAAVQTARLRLEAVTVKTRQSPDLLVGSSMAYSREATGEAAGDFFGIDIGL